MADLEYPGELRYSTDHEWVRDGGEGAPVRVGITAFAQDSLGDVVFVEVPEVGATLTAGEACGEVESTKSVSDLVAPVSGTVVSTNSAVVDTPELVNSAPYGDGWLFEVELSDPSEVQALLGAEDYRASL